jgi:hypothetical protein
VNFVVLIHVRQRFGSRDDETGLEQNAPFVGESKDTISAVQMSMARPSLACFSRLSTLSVRKIDCLSMGLTLSAVCR